MMSRLLSFAVCLLHMSWDSGFMERPEIKSLSDWARADPKQLWEEAKFRSGPVGGYLYRFHYDVTGDGVVELLVANSLELSGTQWHIYRRGSTDESSYKKIAEFAFRPSGVFFVRKDDQSDSPMFTTFVSVNREVALINSAEYGENGLKQSTVKEIQGADRRRFPEGFDVGTKVSPRIEKVLLCEYVSDPSVQWRPYLPHVASEYQHNEPAEEEHIQRMGADCERIVKEFIESSK